MSALTDLTAQHFKGPKDDGYGITCDLPRKGDRVWVKSKETGGLRFHKRAEGNATVKFHWHYDGCILDLEMDDGSDAVAFPESGDDVVPIDALPPSVLDRAEAIYRSQHQ